MRALLPKLTSKTFHSSRTYFLPGPFATENPNYIPSNKPTSAYYDGLVCAAGRKGDYVTLRSLLNNRFIDGCFNTNSTFKFISTDLSVLNDLIHHLSLLDKGFPRKSAFDSLISCLCKIHRPDKALRVAEEMVKKGYGAKVDSFHPILKALSRKKKMEQAWGVMKLMRENGIPVDVTAYNYILTGYCVDGDLESAVELLGKMENEGLVADERTYDGLVLGACRAGKVEGALMVLRRMVDEQVMVLHSTHTHVIGALLKLGYYEQAMEFVLFYAGRDRKLDTESFMVLASRLVGLGRSDEAMLVLEEMNRRRLKFGHKLRDFYELRLNK